MKANEFVKKFGWNDARVCILNCACPEDRWFMRHGDLVSDQDFDDLKRLVESHEMVEKFGGLDKAKKSLEKAYKRFTTKISYSVEIDDKTYLTGVFIEDLEQAIADVESCIEVTK